MAVERAENILRSGHSNASILNRPDIAFENDRQTIQRSIGIDLTNVILSHLNLDLLTMLRHNPTELLSDTPSYPKLQALNKLTMKPEEETKLFTELFASSLTKSWTVSDTKNISEKEKRLALYCAELRNKGYDLKRVMQEACEHFNLSLTEALEIAKKEYFTIDDLARELEMSRGNAKNKVAQAFRKDRTIKPERFGGKEHNRIFIHESQRNNLKSMVESLIQKPTVTVTLPDNGVVTIEGRLQKKILDMLLSTFNQPHGLALNRLIGLYPKGDPNATQKVSHALARLRKALGHYWIIENTHTGNGRRSNHISEYFLKRYQVPEIFPVTPTEKVEVTIFEPRDIKPKFDPRLYSTPKGEKPFYSLSDIARDLGAKESDVKKALAIRGIKGLKGNSSQGGGRKDEMKLSYLEYQIIKRSLQQEVNKRKKKPKSESTSSPARLSPKDAGRF